MLKHLMETKITFQKDGQIRSCCRYYNYSPKTLRKNRSIYGHDGPLVWVKLNGKVLYDLFESDKNLENLSVGKS